MFASWSPNHQAKRLQRSNSSPGLTYNILLFLFITVPGGKFCNRQKEDDTVLCNIPESENLFFLSFVVWSVVGREFKALHSKSISTNFPHTQRSSGWLAQRSQGGFTLVTGSETRSSASPEKICAGELTGPRRGNAPAHLEHVSVGAAPNPVDELVVLQRVQERHPYRVHAWRRLRCRGGSVYRRMAAARTHAVVDAGRWPEPTTCYRTNASIHCREWHKRSTPLPATLHERLRAAHEHNDVSAVKKSLASAVFTFSLQYMKKHISRNTNVIINKIMKRMLI